MRVLSFSETGSVRKNNEDGFLALEEYGVFAVADGMGGHSAGEVAANKALNTIEDFAPQLKATVTEEFKDLLMTALAEANKTVYESANTPETEGMGTTLTVLVLKEDFAAIAHVGDSRAYLWRENRLIPLTSDHSLVGELIRLGQLSKEQAKSHPQRHVLVRALGIDPEIKIDSSMIELEPGDVFLLCTDGFSNMLEEEEVVQEFLEDASWEEHLERLRQLVFERGAPDNFTALCCVME